MNRGRLPHAKRGVHVVEKYGHCNALRGPKASSRLKMQCELMVSVTVVAILTGSKDQEQLTTCYRYGLSGVSQQYS